MGRTLVYVVSYLFSCLSVPYLESPIIMLYLFHSYHILIKSIFDFQNWWFINIIDIYEILKGWSNSSQAVKPYMYHEILNLLTSTLDHPQGIVMCSKSYRTPTLAKKKKKKNHIVCETTTIHYISIDPIMKIWHFDVKPYVLSITSHFDLS